MRSLGILSRDAILRTMAAESTCCSLAPCSNSRSEGEDVTVPDVHMKLRISWPMAASHGLSVRHRQRGLLGHHYLDHSVVTDPADADSRYP